MKAKFYPPAYFLATAMLMSGLNQAAPLLRFDLDFHRLIGSIITGSALAVVVGLASMFRRAKTTIKPFQESTTLFVSGAYRFSRNPIYLALALALCGIAVYLGSLSPLLGIPLFVLTVTHGVIRHEERMLESQFGEAFRIYKNQVRRWL